MIQDQPDTDLLERLNSADAETSVEAARELRTAGPYRVAALVRLAVQMQTRVAHRLAPAVEVSLLFAGLLIAAALRWDGALAGNGVLVAAALAGVTAVIAYQFMPRRDMSGCLGILAVHIEAQSGAEALPSLLASLQDELEVGIPVVVRRAMQGALRRILPNVTAEQYARLTSEQRAQLVHLLRTPYEDAAMSVAVVETLARLADPVDRDAFAVLETFARQGAATRNMEALRSAARQAMEVLADRRAERIRALSLLRPAGSPDMAADLLRAARPSEDQRPEQMLRAAPAGDSRPGAEETPMG